MLIFLICRRFFIVVLGVFIRNRLIVSRGEWKVAEFRFLGFRIEFFVVVVNFFFERSFLKWYMF